MGSNHFKVKIIPVITGSAIFILVLALTQYLTYQQYLIEKERVHETLVHELSNVKDKFRNILYNDITAANTLVIMYKEYGTPKNFDTIARQIVENSKYTEAIQLTEGDVITHVYPLKEYEHTIGLKIKDPMRRQEAQKAIEKKEIFFGGPRKLRLGGHGILGKVPIVANNELKGFCVVLTKLPTIQKELQTSNGKEKKYAYILSKNHDKKDFTDFKLSDTNPDPNSEMVSVEIPEGDWHLRVAYSENNLPVTFPYKLAIFGFFISLISGLFAYRKTNESDKLQKMVKEKTHLLNERVKEVTTIYKINNLLLDEKQSMDELFYKVVELLPSGWQHPEICEAKITFEGENYTTKGYRESDLSLKSFINLADGRYGIIEVVYTERKSPDSEEVFFKEEINLINSVSQIIEIYLNKLAQKEAYNQSEARFRIAFEKASIGMAIVSLEGAWLRVNEALCKMLGYSKEEFSKLNFQQITHPEDLGNDLDSYYKLLKGEKSYYRAEKRYIHKNGSIIWVNLNVLKISDSKNQPLYFVSQIENVTEKVESQTKFRDLVEKSLVGIYIVKDEKIVYVNPQILKEFGYPESEVIGMPIENFICEEDIPVVDQKLQERLEGTIDRDRYEIRIKKKDGSVVWNEMFGVSTTFEGEPAIIGTMVNISDKKKFYDELQKSEANLRSIFDSTKVSYLLVDNDFKIISFNRYFARFHFELTGNDPKIGMGYLEQIPEGDRNKFQEKLHRVLNNNFAVEFEEKVQHNGETLPKYYHFIVTPVKNNGNSIGVCISNIDITDQKSMEIERHHIIKDLTQRNRDLEQFSYIVSHNMRAPIANLMGLINLLEDGMDVEETEAVNQAIKKSVYVLEGVVTDVNEILSLRKDFLQTKVDVNLDEIIQTIKTELYTTIQETNATITCDFSEVDTVLSRQTYIHSIFLNFISNSLKYARKGISPEIKVWTEKKEGEVSIHFKDNGIGIDLKRYGNQIFGLYKKFDMSKEGKGMGLFMVKNQVDALRGSIHLESEPDRGTTFIIMLPFV